MPMYDLKCKACEHEQEELLKRDEKPPPCEECGGELEKTISRGTALKFGRGFFNTGGY